MPYKDPERQRQFQREAVARRRAEYTKPCARCGSTDNIQMHHKDKTTKVSHRIWSWSRKKIEIELAKCEWLCRKCHQDEHRPEPPEHGKLSRYKRPHHCRCDLCRAANAKYQHDRRCKLARS